MPARTDCIFQNSFDPVYIDPQPNLQFRASVISNHVRSGAATEHSDVASRGTEETVLRPMTIANVLEDIKQFFDCRLPGLRIRRMCRASFSRNDHTHRSLRPSGQTTIGRLTVYQELAFARQRVLVRSLCTMTAELFINSEQQSNIIH